MLFAENDVIRAIDLEGLERLIMTGVNKDNRTAALTIKKDIEIMKTDNLSKRYQKISEKRVRKNFEFGNTTLYVKELPVNGSPVEFITKKAWKKGTGYSLDVMYDASVRVIDPSQQNKSLNGDRGRISTVYMAKDSRGFSSPTNTGAVSSAEPGNNVSVKLNPGFNNALSPEDVITHEVGIHNMAQVHHKTDANGKAIYPQEETLESNVPGKIHPVDEDTKKIINANLQEGRLDTDESNK